MKKIVLIFCLMMLLVGTSSAAYEPMFEVDLSGSTVRSLNIVISQWNETTSMWEVPSDSIYHIETPVIITVTNESGPIEDANVAIVGPGTDYNGKTDSYGNVTYIFNSTEITDGENRIIARAYFTGYKSVEDKIYVDYYGILAISKTDSYSYIDIDSGMFSAYVDYVDMEVTPTVTDLKNNDLPVEGANVSFWVSSVEPSDSIITWKENGDAGAGNGDTAINNPQYRLTDANGNATFKIRVDRDSTSTKSKIVTTTRVEKRSYPPIQVESNSDVDSSNACFIATATYGSPLNKNLVILRAFRDNILLTNPVGKTLVKTYYATSPPIAYVLSQSDVLRAATRSLLITPSVYFARICLNPVALMGITIGLVLTLFTLEKQRKSILKGIGFGALTVFAFIGAVLTFGYISYTIPIFAIIGAYLLPIMVPSAMFMAVIGGLGLKRIGALIKTNV